MEKEANLKIEGFRMVYKGVAPFMKYEKGHGYYGVLLEEEESGKIQCHLCGETTFNQSKHLFHKHKGISPKSYKIETGLSLTTPLMSEKTRKKIRNNFLYLTKEKQEEVINNLRGFNKKLHSEKTKKQRTNKASIQTNNKYGTCPEQVRSQFYEIYLRLNRIPNWKELSGRLRYVIEDRFGSYEEALVAWGIGRQEYKEHLAESQNKAIEARRENDFFPKFTDEEVKRQYQDFFSLKNRLPTWEEVKLFGMPGRIPFNRVFKCSKTQVENSLRASDK